MNEVQNIIDHGNSNGRSTSLSSINSKVTFKLPRLGTMSKCKISVFLPAPEDDIGQNTSYFKAKEDGLEIEENLIKILSFANRSSGTKSWFVNTSSGIYDFIFDITGYSDPKNHLRIKFTDENTWGEENGSLVTTTQDIFSISGELIKQSSVPDTFYVYFKFETFSYTGLDIDTQWARLKIGNTLSNSGKLILSNI